MSGGDPPASPAARTISASRTRHGGTRGPNRSRSAVDPARCPAARGGRARERRVNRGREPQIARQRERRGDRGRRFPEERDQLGAHPRPRQLVDEAGRDRLARQLGGAPARARARGGRRSARRARAGWGRRGTMPRAAPGSGRTSRSARPPKGSSSRPNSAPVSAAASAFTVKSRRPRSASMPAAATTGSAAGRG